MSDLTDGGLTTNRQPSALEGNRCVQLGVQPFEAAWLAALPLDKAYVSDRLYLSVESTACMDGKLSAMAIGIFADEPAKRAQMAAAQWLQPVLVQVIQGRVCGVNKRVGSRVSVSGADIIDALASGAQAKLRTKDMSRFF